MLTYSGSISRDRLVFECANGIVNLVCVLFNLLSERHDILPIRSCASMWLKVECPKAFLQFPDGSFYGDEHFSSVYLPR